MLGGKAGVGKTTLAKHIADYAFNQGLRPRLLSFAGVLKKKAAELGYSKEEKPLEYRKYCQRIGQEKRRNDPDYFIKEFHKDVLEIMREEIELLESNVKHWETLVIVDDARYMNEVGYGRKHRATQIFLCAGNRKLPNHDAAWRSDMSEELANYIEDDEAGYEDIFEWIVYNDSSLEDLKEKVEQFLPSWCGLQSDENLIDRIEIADDDLNALWDQVLDKLGEIDDDEEYEDEEDA
tara:strand:+ start:185 stop:892 length:708 start_codon:yes stop_codon:yes gene_type:complete